MEHNAVAEGRRCAECGDHFTITRGETSFYMKRGLILPKRCEACRQARKAADLEGRRAGPLQNPGGTRVEVA